MKSLKWIIIVIILFNLFFAQVPQLINYQGYLSDREGNDLSGSYTIEFRIFDQIEDATLLWSEVELDKTDKEKKQKKAVGNNYFNNNRS